MKRQPAARVAREFNLPEKACLTVRPLMSFISQNFLRGRVGKNAGIFVAIPAPAKSFPR